MQKVQQILFDDESAIRRDGPCRFIVAPAHGTAAVVHVGTTWMNCSCNPRNDIVNCIHKQLIRRSGIPGLVRPLRVERKGAARA